MFLLKREKSENWYYSCKFSSTGSRGVERLAFIDFIDSHH